jgi:hypothetical protein
MIWNTRIVYKPSGKWDLSAQKLKNFNMRSLRADCLLFLNEQKTSCWQQENEKHRDKDSMMTLVLMSKVTPRR